MNSTNKASYNHSTHLPSVDQLSTTTPSSEEPKSRAVLDRNTTPSTRVLQALNSIPVDEEDDYQETMVEPATMSRKLVTEVSVMATAQTISSMRIGKVPLLHQQISTDTKASSASYSSSSSSNNHNLSLSLPLAPLLDPLFSLQLYVSSPEQVVTPVKNALDSLSIAFAFDSGKGKWNCSGAGLGSFIVFLFTLEDREGPGRFCLSVESMRYRQDSEKIRKIVLVLEKYLGKFVVTNVKTTSNSSSSSTAPFRVPEVSNNNNPPRKVSEHVYQSMQDIVASMQKYAPTMKEAQRLQKKFLSEI